MTITPRPLLQQRGGTVRKLEAASDAMSTRSSHCRSIGCVLTYSAVCACVCVCVCSGEGGGPVASDQLTSLISDEVERQLRERGSVLEAMREQMAKVLAEFEEMAANISSKRSWSNSVSKTTKPFVSPKKSPFNIHPIITPLDIVPPAASSPPKLPK